MKNGKQYSQKIKKLFLELKHDAGKVVKVDYDDPVGALVYAAVSEHMTLSAARAAYKRIFSHFVDLNDLRVSRLEEIIDVLGSTRPGVEEIAETLKTLLQAVLNKYDGLSLAPLEHMGKRQARETLEKFEPISLFVVNYVMMTSLSGHAFPLTQKMTNYLKAAEYVNPDAEEKEIAGFLERQISASSMYTFYMLPR